MIPHILNSVQPVVNVAALDKLWQGFLKDWVGPAYFIMVAVLSFKFLKNSQVREFGVFVLVAILVGLMVFAASTILGGANSGLIGAANKNVQGGINTILTSGVNVKDLLHFVF